MVWYRMVGYHAHAMPVFRKVESRRVFSATYVVNDSDGVGWRKVLINWFDCDEKVRFIFSLQF